MSSYLVQKVFTICNFLDEVKRKSKKLLLLSVNEIAASSEQLVQVLLSFQARMLGAA